MIAASKYFETMFHSNFNDRNSATITIGGDVINFNVLEKLVVFMESKALKPTDATLEQLFVAADYLQISSALRVLSDHLYTDLGSKRLDDVRRSCVHRLLRLIDILTRFAKSSGYSHLTRTVMYPTNSRPSPIKCSNDAVLYIAYHFKTIMFDHALLKLDYSVFERIVKSDFLRITEEEVVRSIKIWINHDYQERKKYFGPLIKCVRFDDTMSVDFLMEEVLDFADSEAENGAAKDYVISILAKRLGYSKDISDLGPSNPKKRIHRRWEQTKTPTKDTKGVAGGTVPVKEEPSISN